MPREKPDPLLTAHGLFAAAGDHLATGRRDLALGRIDAMLKLPWDPCIDGDAALGAGYMMFDGAVSGAWEECPEDDTSWTQAVEDVLGRCGGLARVAMARALRKVLRDCGLDDWTRHVIRRRLLPESDPGADPDGAVDDTPWRARVADPERRQLLLELATARNIMNQAFAHHLQENRW